jgi:hypothetical protein
MKLLNLTTLSAGDALAGRSFQQDLKADNWLKWTLIEVVTNCAGAKKEGKLHSPIHPLIYFQISG